MKLTLEEGNQVIGLELVLTNNLDDQRTRLIVPTALSANFSIADNQFGVIQRPIIDEAINIWEEEAWDERPDSIYPFLSHVALSNEKTSLSSPIACVSTK